MPSGNECPACGENIGVWAVFRAPLPNRIYCPHCRERLRYGDTALMIAAAVVCLLAAVAVGVACAAIFDVNGPTALGIVLGTFILGALFTEVVFVGVLWFGSFRLESVSHPKSEWDEEAF